MSPLVKRLPRELKTDFGKYAVIFLFMIMLISLVSGYLVATNSMLAEYDESFTEYNIEHGHLTFDKPLPEDVRAELETVCGVQLYDLRYFDEKIKDTEQTVRVYIHREQVNKGCLMAGAFPQRDDEIAIDRVFAHNNGYAIGDTLTIRGRTLTVCGYVALSDYSALFRKNTDMMLDAIRFSVAEMTAEGFAAVNSPNVQENYAWLYNDACDHSDKAAANTRAEQLADDLSDVLKRYDEAIVEAQVSDMKDRMETAGKEYAAYYMQHGRAPKAAELSVELSDLLYGIVADSVQAQLSGEAYEMPDEEAFADEIDQSGILSVSDLVPQHLNQAITFAGMDMGGDKGAFILFSYIVVAVLAFIFAVTISGTVAAEAGVIGTLRASGYSRGELVRHYLCLPILVTLVSAAVGNALGYSWFRKVMEEMYYNTYSLTTYRVRWNAEAFLTTTVVPGILMLVINWAVIAGKMKLTPLQFLRRELKRKPCKKALRLNTKIPFAVRFRLRILLQNLPSYLVMIAGIILGAMIIVFGDMFTTLFEDYAVQMQESVICEHQYVLKEQEETDSPGAEKYAMTSYEFQQRGFMKDEISVYGIEPDSRYVSAETGDGLAAVSNTIAAKYGLGIGDTMTLQDAYDPEKNVTLTIGSIYDYDAALAVFLSRADFNRTFGHAAEDFTGYFSDAPLTGLDPDNILMDITVSDFTRVSEQMINSLGAFLKYFGYFGVVMFVLMMYILSKQIIERNFQSISMCKILGFKNGEIGGLYIVSTSIAVVCGLLAAVPLTDALLHWAFEFYLYKVMTGYFPCNVRPESYVRMIVIGLLSYAVVSGLQMWKINRIPKGEALKNRE